jgi:catechol 2,3-dioxygenase-like lactoylglutathione lyase family enzyme
VNPRWLTLFFDYGRADFKRGLEFWAAITGSTFVTESGNESSDFVGLQPAVGHAYLEFQRTREPEGTKHHLCIAVDDVAAARQQAVAAGASRVAEHDDYSVLCSPGGMQFCFVPAGTPAADRPFERTTTLNWPTGQRSIPSRLWEVEVPFWEQILGAELSILPARPEFGWLRAQQQFSLDVLVQRLNGDQPVPTLHPDLGTNDRALEVARHLALGADHVLDEEFWALMRDPCGAIYCITDRDPITGRLTAARGNP